MCHVQYFASTNTCAIRKPVRHSTMYASRYSGIGKLYHEMPVAAPHSLSPGSCPSRRSLQRVGSSLYKVLKLTVSQIVNKLYTFYETQVFITMQKNRHWPLWPDHSASPNLISLWSNWISSSLYAKVCQVVSLYRYYDHFTSNSNKSPIRCNNFPVYYPDVYLQLNMFRVVSRPSSGAQWLQWQPLVLPSYRGDSRAVFVVGPAVTTIRR